MGPAELGGALARDIGEGEAIQPLLHRSAVTSLRDLWLWRPLKVGRTARARRLAHAAGGA